MNNNLLNPDAFELACKELFLTITAHKSAADVLGFDWKSLKASTRKPWETATRKVLTAYLEAEGTAEELHEINTRLARILTDTANALKGEPEPHVMHSWHDLAEVAKRAVDGLKEQTDVQSVDNYLAVAQPVVNRVESLPAKMRMLAWEGGEIEVGEIPEGHVLVGFEMATDRAWSMADKVTIHIERPEVPGA
ncbi:hypothetical protein [Glutamicibacter ardleyensis]|uniref:Uncharacterized protein n=1 Tax=Glutamicibacter ardleyensis TaxID=225894 RepID=A0ABQ2DJ88_9MICC|nr:hypothetical protein [Glutamicibacter ardleyensis]GGJ59119.1 hypothetical protein GCM10007173_17320 [Glutamicibacter ardleyensis]